MNVFYKNNKVQKSYEDICHDLKIDPDVHFVKVTNRGTITFTCGKPNEVRDLLSMCMYAGYKPAKSLLEACN